VDGWTEAEVDAYVSFGAGGIGTRDSPFDTIADAIAAGARRIALASGMHDLDEPMTTVPLELYGACAEETILQAVLRMRAELVLEDVTVIGGIETCDLAALRRVHLHGGPLLGERAQITAVDLALHDSHIVLGDSTASFDRLFVASDLDSFTCWGTRATIEGALLTDRSGSALVVTSTCSLEVRDAVLLPFDIAARVEGNANLLLSDAFVEGTEGGVLIKEGGTATITRVRSKGDEGLEVAGFARVEDAIFETTDLDGGAALTNFGRITGARVHLIGGERGITTVGMVLLSDVMIDSDSLGVVVGVDGEVILSGATISSRVACVDAIGTFYGDDLSLLQCETGLSTSGGATVHRAEALGPRIGAAIFAGRLELTDVHFRATVAGIDVENGEVLVSSFLIEEGPVGAALGAAGEMSLKSGRLSGLQTGLVLPPEIRPEQVLDEVSFTGVERVFETR
jgi:hypothetical protein